LHVIFFKTLQSRFQVFRILLPNKNNKLCFDSPNFLDWFWWLPLRFIIIKENPSKLHAPYSCYKKNLIGKRYISKSLIPWHRLRNVDPNCENVLLSKKYPMVLFLSPKIENWVSKELYMFIFECTTNKTKPFTTFILLIGIQWFKTLCIDIKLSISIQLNQLYLKKKVFIAFHFQIYCIKFKKIFLLYLQMTWNKASQLDDVD